MTFSLQPPPLPVILFSAVSLLLESLVVWRVTMVPWRSPLLISIKLTAAFFFFFFFVKVSGQREGDIRLAGYGASQLSGRLEVYHHQDWFTVCSPSDLLDVSKVACRQLGLGHFISHIGGTASLRYGLGSGSILKYRCHRDDLHLMRCSYSNMSTCNHNQDLSVTCSGVLTPYEGEVRLVGGAYSSVGVVELHLHHTWSQICSTNMEPGLAVSICRNLGFTGVSSVLPVENATGTFWQLPSPSLCTNSSHSCLKSCFHDNLFSLAISRNSCSTEEGLRPWRLTCTFVEEDSYDLYSGSVDECSINIPTPYEENEIRLRGDDSDQGRVELYSGNGEWSTLQSLKNEEAAVICKQLGFPNYVYHYPISKLVSSGPLPPATGPQIKLSCTGLETHVNGCTFSTPTFQDHNDDAYLHCSDVHWPFGSLQLVGGAGSFGQLVISPGIDFVWLCDAHFSMKEADVACRQLGYSSAIRTINNSLVYTPTVTNQLQYTFYCSGDEDYLMECERRSYSSTVCRDSLDKVAIQCGSSGTANGWKVQFVSVADGDDSIHNDSNSDNSTSVKEGIVEVQLEEGGEWGLICGEAFSNRTAHVICRHLGYETYTTIELLPTDEDTGRVSLTKMQCTGFEEHLDYCPHSLLTDECSHIISLHCSEDLPLSDGMLRLINTSSSSSASSPSSSSSSSSSSLPTSGRLEIAYHGLWMSVCGVLFNQEAANVACAQLGFAAAANYCTNACYGSGGNEIHFGEYSCSGNESRLLDCDINIHNVNSCNHDYDVGISCFPLEEVPVATVTSSLMESYSSSPVSLPSLSLPPSSISSIAPVFTRGVTVGPVIPTEPGTFEPQGIYYAVAVAMFILFLSVIVSITICCVVRKRRETLDLQARSNSSYSDQNDEAIAEGRENGDISLQEVMNGETNGPDFDFDAVADELDMKVCAKAAEAAAAMSLSPSHGSLSSSSAGPPPQYHELEFLSHSIPPGEETKDLD